MNPEAFIRALDLPSTSLLMKRIPKIAFVRNGAPTARDRRKINEEIEGIKWIATLKPTTISVQQFVDSKREYLEINILQVSLKVTNNYLRIVELIHRAIPYPIVLLTEDSSNISISLAHKRWSEAAAGQTVIDGSVLICDLQVGETTGLERSLLNQVSLLLQPRTNLYLLYQGWFQAIQAFDAGKITGKYQISRSHEETTSREKALKDYQAIEMRIAGIRAAATKEKQTPRLVQMNLELQELEKQKKAVLLKL